MAKLLTLISERPEDLAFCKSLAAKLHLVFQHYVIGSDLSLQVKEPTLVFIDVEFKDPSKSAENSGIIPLLRIISKSLVPAKVFALADKTMFELPQLNRVETIGHYFVRNYDSFALDWAEKLIRQLDEDDAFNLKGLLESDAKEVKITLNESGEKEKTLEAVRKLLLGKKIHERCAEVIVRAVDELVMNAVFSAPVDDKGRTYRKSLERKSNLLLWDKEVVTLKLILNPQCVMVCVEDQFGSFSFESAMKVIHKDYSNTEYKTDAFTQSAGLGLHGIISGGFGLMMNVKPGVGTQAILAFPFFKNFKSMRGGFRSFSVNLLDK